jgi:hypothetical protein
MSDNVTALSMPAASDQAPLAAMAEIASLKKKRREPAEGDFNADFDELCGLIGERLAHTGPVDAQFCQLVGLLPELRNIKDRVLVREAKIIAACLGRDDTKTPTAQLIVGGLASRLRPFSGLPAAHVMLGILMFFGALLGIDVCCRISGKCRAGAPKTPPSIPGSTSSTCRRGWSLRSPPPAGSAASSAC